MLRLSIRDSSGERVFATEREEILVGSREGADLRIPSAAPNHCLLRAKDGRVRLLSLSGGGTTVAGRPVAGEAMLGPGAEFSVGATVVRVLACGGASRLALEEPSPSPPPRRPPHATPHAAHDHDFAREVRAAFAKAPWYLTSLVVHIVLLLLLSLVETRQAPADRVAQLAAGPSRQMAEPELPPDGPLDLEAIERDLSELDRIEFEDLPSEQVQQSPGEAEISDIDDIVTPDRLGTAGGRRPTMRLQKPLPYNKVKGGDEAINKADLDGEQGRATDEVRRGLGDGLRRARSRLTRDSIVVVRGEFDKIEDILDKYGWPYTLVSREELLQLQLPKARILFVNCARKPPPAQCGKLAELTKRFLSRGCWIVTSDWSVDPYVTMAFPTHVHLGGRERAQRDTTVEVEAESSDHLLDGVFGRGGEHEWWLEDSSTMVTVTDKATTLVASEDMKKRYGSRVVAFKFAYGEGVVVHLVGHFYQKDGNRRGLVAMHRLINNVIVGRVEADEKR